MFLAQKPVLARLIERHDQVLHRERVFVAYVHVALVAADGESADEHALDHQVRIALQKRAVHVRARIALVRVADHVLRLAFGLPHGIPFPTGREAAAAAPAKIGLDHLFHDEVGRHREKSLGQRLVPVYGDVVLDPQRVHVHVQTA